MNSTLLWCSQWISAVTVVGPGYKTNSVEHIQMSSLAQSTAMTEYTVYMCSRMLGMITNPVIWWRHDFMSSLLWWNHYVHIRAYTQLSCVLSNSVRPLMGLLPLFAHTQVYSQRIQLTSSSMPTDNQEDGDGVGKHTRKTEGSGHIFRLSHFRTKIWSASDKIGRSSG